MGCSYSRCCIGRFPTSPKDVGDDKKITDAGVVGGATFSPSSSGDDEDADQLINQVSMTRDSDTAINRLSRVSSQFLPPDGARSVKVPSSNYELRYSFLSQRGYYPDALDKANQDSFCVHTPFGTSVDDHFFGVFDGHGEYGAQCSQFVKRKLCENLLRNSRFHLDAVETFHSAYVTTNTQLHSDSIDDSMSGTTAITLLVRGRTIYVANTGDSRAVIAEKKGEDLVAVDLSIDQTPYRTDELERVKRCGARVLTLDQIEGLKNPSVQCWGTEEADDGDPPRLWVPTGMFPGTAFTRSIGDSIAETIGVVATPEIVVFELKQNHPYFVIASDGVFEFMSSQNVVDMVAKFKDPRDACAAIVAESYKLWLQFETRTDDITIIVVHVNGLTDDQVDSAVDSRDEGPRALPQIVEMTGSESPSAISWNSSKNTQRMRHDLSRARLRALETSLENGHPWVPSSPSHRKTWEEEAHIQHTLRDHFLFRKLTESQSQVLLDCMQRLEVNPGDIVVQQGEEGDCFYVVGSGEFEVLATQVESEKQRVLQRYTADKLSSFGELALMYNKPLQSSVRAVTKGTLWSLRREDFRGILTSEFSNLSSLKLLRSVDLLSRLTILQLSHIADSLLELSFSDGQTIVDKSEPITSLYIIQKGRVRLTYPADLMGRSPNMYSLMSDDQVENHDELSIEKDEGSYFGEWGILGEDIGSITATSIGDVVCLVLSRENFESAAGPFAVLARDDKKMKVYIEESLKQHTADTDTENYSEMKFSDLEWGTCIHSTDCCEIGVVLVKDSGKPVSLKRFAKEKVKRFGKEAHVLKEKALIKSLGSLTCVPKIVHTLADQFYAGLVLNTCLACPLASIILTPLDEFSAKFIAASVVIALEELHMNSVLYRGVSPDVLLLDRTGFVQFVDFRFGKKLLGERTFTICGMADSLAPEIVQGRGHGFPADWWALGVLIYFMLKAEMPFGTWRENELDTYAKIAKGLFTLPHSLSPEAVDLITKLLEVDETTRFGNDGPDSVKSHAWFSDIDWEKIKNRNYPVPEEVLSRIEFHLQSRSEDLSISVSSPSFNISDLNTPEWLEDW